MNISGIRPTAAIYEYKIIKEGESKELVQQQVLEEPDLFTEQKKQTETAFSYAHKYEPDKKYEMKGSDSSLEELDMEQAISDRRKEQLLKQYQFFVETSQRGKKSAIEKKSYPYENFDI